MALKVETEIIKNLKCIMCEKEIESLAFPYEEETICLNCVDECMRQAEKYNEYLLSKEKE